jgi:lysophospholipase L1-like esterase
MKYFAAALLALALLLTMNHGKKSVEPLAPGESILAFGDSLTHGYGAGPGESYPDVLSKLTGLRVINAGVNGETSREGLRRLPGLLDHPETKLLILCEGGNDILQKRPLSELKENLRAMIRLAKGKGIAVLLLSVPDFGLLGLSALPLYEELAEEEDVPLLDGVLAEILSRPELKSDPIHPNAAGYRRMAERIYEALRNFNSL